MTDFLRAILFATAHACSGSLGVAIMAVSFVLRLALLPLTLRIARRARRQQAILQTLQPRLKALQQTHAADPARLWRETSAVYQEHGVQLMSLDGIIGLLVQWPILGAFFAVLRKGVGARVAFLWIGDLARPDRWLATGVTALTALGAMAIMPATASKATLWFSAGLSAALTFAFLWFASSALALSYAGGSAVSLLQGWLMRRDGESLTA